jgi:hypothetical protein
MSKGQEFLDTSIVPALTALSLDTLEARMILLGTAMQESGLRDIDQTGGGPAHGPFQIEGPTRSDILHWASVRHPQWFAALEGLTGAVLDAAVARLLYERAPGAIGATPEEQAAYYKQWYNTPLGKATTTEYLANWAVVSEGVVFDQTPLGGTPPLVPATPIPEDAVTIADQAQGGLSRLQPMEPGASLFNLDEPVTEVIAQGTLDEPTTTQEDQGGLIVQVTDLGTVP